MTARTTIRIVGLVLLAIGFLSIVLPIIPSITTLLGQSEATVEGFWYATLIIAGSLVSASQPWTKYWILGWIPFVFLCSWISVYILDDLGFLGPHQLCTVWHSSVLLCTCCLIPLSALGYLILGICPFMTLEESADTNHTYCLKCGCNLTGNVSGVCPECGEKI